MSFEIFQVGSGPRPHPLLICTCHKDLHYAVPMSNIFCFLFQIASSTELTKTYCDVLYISCIIDCIYVNLESIFTASTYFYHLNFITLLVLKVD